MNTKILKTGMLVTTIQINEEMTKNPKFSIFCQKNLEKHRQCDWGDVCEEDKKSNDFSLENDERILSSYNLPDDIPVEFESKIWIITEYDRSVTTILFPSEY
jgi:hypothetical protein